MSRHKPNTKAGKILSHLDKMGSITTWEAIKLYRATRLSDVIFRLKQDGYIIESKKMKSKDGGTFAKYILIGK